MKFGRLLDCCLRAKTGTKAKNMSSSEEALSIFRKWSKRPTALTLTFLSTDKPSRLISMHRVKVSSIDEIGKRASIRGVGETFELVVHVDASSFSITDGGETIAVSTATERFSLSTLMSAGEP